jgi:hypothetical protein
MSPPTARHPDAPVEQPLTLPRLTGTVGAVAAGATIPWRGPGGDRPLLPLPPGPMPLRRHGENRKRWRYVGVFTEELMLCAARAEVGPLSRAFWVLWDRRERLQLAHTALRPGSREVRFGGASLKIEADGLRASLRLGAAKPVESICASGERSWAWTRKRGGVPIEGTIELPGRRLRIRGLGVDDESAGYHAHRTAWRWSAGVGEAAGGRAVAWNLVEGVNDPPERSERAIWVDGHPHEPPPCRFDDLDAVEVDGGRLRFAAESEHRREERYLLFGSLYRHRFGSFSGRLGDLELTSGLGVMERHKALW